MINAYVYRITNTVTNEFYYGYRSKNQNSNTEPVNDLWIKYFTSSNRIKNDILQYGKESFIAEIVYEHIEYIHCWRREQILIHENWGNSLLLNQRYHNPDSDLEVYRRKGIQSKETRKKMSAAGKGRSKTDEHKKKIAVSNTGKKASLEARAKMSEARKRRPTSNKGITPPKYECPHCGRHVSNGNFRRWHGDNCKTIDQAGHRLRTKHITSLNKKA